MDATLDPGPSVGFIEPMLVLESKSLPEDWHFELKLDGYRAIAFRPASGQAPQIRSRTGADFTRRYAAVSTALAAGLPAGAVVDGEIVALDASGRPSFNALQNHSSAPALVYYVFDLLSFAGRSLLSEPLNARREMLEQRVLPLLPEPIRYSCQLQAPLPLLIESVRAQGLEGLVAKRPGSVYEPGKRSGAWRKLRLNQTAEFVIGGYTRGPKTFDALVIGRFDGSRLHYVARTRNGFTPLLREQLFSLFPALEIPTCPFANLPETRPGRWGAGLTAEKMRECRWLQPVLAAEFEFVEITAEGHLRHVRFVRLAQPGAR